MSLQGFWFFYLPPPAYSAARRRPMSTPMDQLKTLDNVIGAAGGPDKAEAILAVLRGGYLDVLITDEDTAQLLLEAEP